MKCPECKKGRLFVRNGNPLKKGGLYARRYVCDNCKYHLETVEIPRKEYHRQHDLVVALKIAVNNYVTDRKQRGR